MAGGKDPRSEGRIGEPTYVWSAARAVKPIATEIAEVKENAAEGRDPEAEGVQPRKRHIARADHQRD